MADGDPEQVTRTRRRRDAEEPGGLSVADLLAKHGADVSPRETNQHSLRGQPQDEPVADDDQDAPPGWDTPDDAGGWDDETARDDPRDWDEPDGWDVDPPRSPDRNGYPGPAPQPSNWDNGETAEFYPRRVLDSIFPKGVPNAPASRPGGGAYDVLGDDDQGVTEKLFPKGSISALNSPLGAYGDQPPRRQGGTEPHSSLDQPTSELAVQPGPQKPTSPVDVLTAEISAEDLFDDAPAGDDASDDPVVNGRRPDLPSDRSHDERDADDEYGRDEDDREDDHDDEPVEPEVSEVPAAPRTEREYSGDQPEELVGFELRAAKIDETLTRLTAIHAGMGKEMTARVSRTGKVPVVAPKAEPEAAEPPAPPEPPSTRRKAVRIVAIAAAVALFVAITAGWITQLQLDGKLRTVAALDPNSGAIVDAAAQAGDHNYLMIGTDPGGLDQTVTGAVKATGMSTVLLAHVPAARDRVVWLSLPANLEIDRPSCDTYNQASASYPGGTTPAQSGVQLASAFQVGGPRCVTKAIQQLTGLAVNHFTALDLAGVQNMVDAMNGLVVCVPKPVLDSQLGPIVSAVGKQVMGGQTALTYIRAQHVRGESPSGVEHNLRQQAVLAALLARGTSDQTVGSIGKLERLVSAFAEHSVNDSANLTDIGKLASAMHDVDPTKVDFVGVPTAAQPDTRGNQVLRPDDAKTLFDQIRTNKALPGEGASTTTVTGPTSDDAASATVPPSAITLVVRNGSSKSGLANQAADSLRTLGYTVSKTGDSPHLEDGKSVIRSSPDQADQAATLAQAVPSAITQTVSGTGTLELVLGDSFDGQVQAAQGPAAAAPPSLVTAAALSCK
ncbi:LCP family protein [Pseudonocardia spinosispora]|uniref:LCP family protein n=1 Tax=Pseudonocardia spinosispora TaxID=103441 RepID=UPI0004032C70|nr:LCP family protein [Pseudonocardia spinosispora]